jgi:hypothetical protein
MLDCMVKYLLSVFAAAVGVSLILTIHLIIVIDISKHDSTHEYVHLIAHASKQICKSSQQHARSEMLYY